MALEIGLALVAVVGFTAWALFRLYAIIRTKSEASWAPKVPLSPFTLLLRLADAIPTGMHPPLVLPHLVLDQRLVLSTHPHRR
jgi:hypothetical protein